MTRRPVSTKKQMTSHLVVGLAVAVGLPDLAAHATEPEAATRGVVVEEVGAGSALEKAGVRIADLLLAWKRPPHPPANPESAQGRFTSPFDWKWLVTEQAPRGRIELRVERQGEEKVLEVAPGLWEGAVRPWMAGDPLAAYSKGKEHIAAGDLAGAMAWWGKVAGSPAVDGALRCWMLLRTAEAWAEAREWEKADSTLRAALGECRESRARVAAWTAAGAGHEKQNQFEKAREAYVEAWEIGRRTWGESSLHAAMSLNQLGSLARKRRNHAAAAESFQSALEIRQQLAPSSLEVAGTLNNLGNVAWHRGDLAAAATFYQRALEIRQKLAPSSLVVAQSLNNLGVIAINRGDLAGAAEYNHRSLEIQQQLAPHSLSVAMVLNNLGVLAFESGDLAGASEYHRRALEIKQRLAPDSLDTAKSLNNLGLLSWRRGDLMKAVEFYQRSLEIQQRLAPLSLDVATSLNNLGLVAVDRADLERAAEFYRRSLEIKQRLAPDGLEVAESLNNIGSLASSRGDFIGAADYLERSLEIKQRLAPDSLDVSASLSNLGVVAFERGDLAAATAYHEGALEIQQQLAPDGSWVAISLKNLGTLAFSRGDLLAARVSYERALEIQRKLVPDTWLEAQTLHGLATLRRRQNQPRLALDLFRQAMKSLENQVARLGGSHDIQAGFRARYGEYYRDTVELLLELSRPEEALYSLERSRAQSFLAQLTERDLIFSDIPEALDRERRRIAVVYDRTQRELAKLDPQEDPDQLEILASRLRELRFERQDVIAEIRRASPRLAALQYPEPLTFQEAQETLDAGTVLLSFSIGEERSHLFVVTRDAPLAVHALDAGEAKLAQQVQRLRQQIYGRGWSRLAASRRVLAHRLYQTLIEPAAETIAASERVLVVPDGPLHHLPFAALVRETEGADSDPGWQYLVEWKPIHTVLSATVYAELQGTRRPSGLSPADEPAILLAAFGDPDFPQELRAQKAPDFADVRVRSAVERGLFGFEPLPHSRREVEQIASLYAPGVVRTFLGQNATEERAKGMGKDVRILHFATHATVDDRFPLNSALALTIPQELTDGRENGLLQAWEIFESLRLDADLVVLSGCRTGLGEELAGEGLIGLTRAFQYAGARSVAATLWRVPDATTVELMRRFYRHLRGGKAKDEALRSAQLELLRGPIRVAGSDAQSVEIDASAPYYWAAFQIFGDWR